MVRPPFLVSISQKDRWLYEQDRHIRQSSPKSIQPRLDLIALDNLLGRVSPEAVVGNAFAELKEAFRNATSVLACHFWFSFFIRQ